jgi:hypothetical protein
VPHKPPGIRDKACDEPDPVATRARLRSQGRLDPSPQRDQRRSRCPLDVFGMCEFQSFYVLWANQPSDAEEYESQAGPSVKNYSWLANERPRQWSCAASKVYAPPTRGKTLVASCRSCAGDAGSRHRRGRRNRLKSRPRCRTRRWRPPLQQDRRYTSPWGAADNVRACLSQLRSPVEGPTNQSLRSASVAEPICRRPRPRATAVHVGKAASRILR